MRGARPDTALEATVREHLAGGADETLVVGVSGGADSVALGALCAHAARENGGRVAFVHVDHGVRARRDVDEAVVLALGAALGVRVIVRALPRCDRPPSEARLRSGRYGALLAVARELGAREIAVGHHARDQAETVLLALFRGTGPSGLRGMPPRRSLADGVDVIRPLLAVDPLELRAYCARHHLAVAVDASNDDVRLRRNAVRALLAGVRPQFPGLDAAVARAAAILRDERAGDPRAALREGVRASLAGTALGTTDVSFAGVEAVVRALEAGRPGRHFLRRGVEAIVE